MAGSDLRGPSADALADLVDELGQVAGRGASEGSDGSDLSRVGDDLFAVARVLRQEASVRRMVTDVATESAAKSGLVRQLLGDKIGAAALDLVAHAVERRWTRSRDLADALEHVGVVAVVDSAGGEASRLSDELFAVGRLLEDEPELRSALSDPARSASDKAALLRTILEGRTLPATVRLAEQALSGTERTVSIAIEEYQKIAADAHGARVATVRVAKELSASDEERLAAALSRQYDRPVHLNVILEPGLIGGMRVEIGDDVIDGTVSSRLDDARRRLAG
ncbi:ATP synthase F1 subcomplex delta subunit [Nocardioides scoriae]|uniref:ATP synthase subunit delta n=1 Tax=Nocardioides scoriae TaxID=642780 RepID=A0A1H1XZ61_9ACTN|nr:F0F1 ATP synthase subunit delta [Nocardioides scoriae]SDT14472.1 ATP synthase F1 subcomplex delta subunit [Nocardioides scoriae]